MQFLKTAVFQYNWFPLLLYVLFYVLKNILRGDKRLNQNAIGVNVIKMFKTPALLGSARGSLHRIVT